MVRTQVIVTLQLLRIMSEFIIDSAILGFYVYASRCGHQKLAKSSPQFGRQQTRMTALQSPYVRWGYNQVQSITPSFAFGARQGRSTL